MPVELLCPISYLGFKIVKDPNANRYESYEHAIESINAIVEDFGDAA